MKKLVLFAGFFLLLGITSLLAQNLPIRPIPSYNYPLSSYMTGFAEIKPRIPPPPSREKRDMEVTVSSSSTSGTAVFAKVWAVKDGGVLTFGPFIVYEGEQLSIPIDNARWGAVVQCDWNVSISIWID